MERRISEPKEFSTDNQEIVILNTEKSIQELSIMATVSNHEFYEDGMIMLKSNGFYLTSPIILNSLPNKFKVSSFLMDNIDPNIILNKIEVIYFKGKSNGIWTIVFLEEPDFSWQAE